jgi:hypothetical protein
MQFMIKMDTPNNAIARLLADAERLVKWANLHGTETQKQWATDFLTLAKHAGKVLSVSPAVENK